MLEHRYGATLLSCLLSGNPAPELGDDATLESVTFQASGISPVDDLVVAGRSPDGGERRVSIGVRRAPALVRSDHASAELLTSYVRIVAEHWPAVRAGRWRLALAVASPNPAVHQLRELTVIARAVGDEAAFRAEVARPGRTNDDVRGRLVHIDALVTKAAGRIHVDGVELGELTWRLLLALYTRELRLEGGDETDRTVAVGQLRAVVVDDVVTPPHLLFPRLAELAARYAPSGAHVTESVLRRDLSGTPLRTTTAHRSAYLQFVRDAAPAVLVGRERELAELEQFCLDDGPGYRWLRAGPWAGKSALMRWFVLHPPAGVAVVSFFVTAQHPGQHDRAGFVDVLLQQMGELLGGPPPPLTQATREVYLIEWLHRAAAELRGRDLRLVLAVDGLDEDRGVTPGPDSHSIAALLPRHLPENLKVIVTGRPNPELPFDVPDDHPLRKPEAARQLEPSPEAQIVRAEMERELRHLLHGTSQERDLLGVLAAAGGGLTGADLAMLNGLDPLDIDKLLKAVSGRTFVASSGPWRADERYYALGHEELQQEAVRVMGRTRLLAYRERIHAWADRFRNAGWPGDTPGYLLGSYVQLLIDTADLDRLIMFATDGGRHDRMLDVSGGDNAALTEMAAAAALLRRPAHPDLRALLRLAVHRDRLLRRNERMPEEVPAVWAALGNRNRAEALARAILRSDGGADEALILLAEEIARNGDYDKARQLAEEIHLYRRAGAFCRLAMLAHTGGGDEQLKGLLAAAETAAAAVTTDVEIRSSAFGQVAVVRATVGDLAGALDAIDKIEVLDRRFGEVLIRVAKLAAAMDEEPIVRAIVDYWRPDSFQDPPQWLIAQSVTLAELVGDLERAEAESALITSVVSRCAALAFRARAAEAQIAADYARSAGDIALSAPDEDRVTAQLHVVRAWIAARDLQASVQALHAMTVREDHHFPDRSALERALEAVAEQALANGEVELAAGLAVVAAERGLARANADMILIHALVDNGELSRAESIARAGTDLAANANALAVVAYARARAGDHERAAEIAIEIERSVRAAARLDSPVALTELALVLLKTGSHDHVGWLVAQIHCGIMSDAHYDDRDLVTMRLVGELVRWERFAEAEALANALDPGGDSLITEMYTYHRRNAGRRGQVTAEPADAEPVEVRIGVSVQGSSDQEIRDLFEAADRRERPDYTAALAEAGRVELAESLALGLDDLNERTWALAPIVRPACERGDVELAERVSLAIPQDHERAKALATIAGQVPDDKERADRAEAEARGVRFAEERSEALAAFAAAMFAVGDVDRALSVARSIDLPPERAKALLAIADQLSPPARRRLIAEALSFAAWDVVLPWLVAHEPATLDVVVEELGVTGDA
ncbi:hypothetical protein GCM10023170_093600 [Phytohabitans houttuyneae]|uniref:NACHT domain-containing protein n=1 Tax=Phytohabitans houttuyneae TaxID=1076126 RepID=A0A6V8KP91_9ACTN|nr:hypothetical protein Phou_078560 [Phytohabitans houttuyneae]